MREKSGNLVSWSLGDEMLNSEEVGKVFALHSLGWSPRRISRELKVARNTVKGWLKAGPERHYSGPRRGCILDAHREWLRSRWRAGVA